MPHHVWQLGGGNPKVKSGNIVQLLKEIINLVRNAEPRHKVLVAVCVLLFMAFLITTNIWWFIVFSGSVVIVIKLLGDQELGQAQARIAIELAKFAPLDAHSEQMRQQAQRALGHAKTPGLPPAGVVKNTAGDHISPAVENQAGGTGVEPQRRGGKRLPPGNT